MNTQLVSKLKLFFAKGRRFATIDAAKAAPPPSPLAPIDLTDEQQVAGVMDLAARIGDILLSSGTGNNDTKAQIHAVASAYGLHYCHVDITFNTITVFTHVSTFNNRPVSIFRVVRKMSLDFSKLQEVDRLIRSIQAGATPPAVAEKTLSDIVSAPTPYGLYTAVTGWAVMGGAVAVMIGGDWLVATISTLSGWIIMMGFKILGDQGLPEFFKNLYGGIVATLPAALMYRFALDHGIHLIPSQIVASGIVVMLAGLTLVQALQDGITGAPVTASARFFDTMLLTGGIIAGIGVGIQLAAAMNFSLPPLDTVQAGPVATPIIKVLSGAVASAAFAVACYAEWGSVIISGITSAMGSAVYYLVFLPAGVGPVVGIGIAATVIGLTGGLLARRFLVPPLITAVAGITPLLPGLAIYRGMYAILHDQLLLGFAALAIALAIGTSLASGVVLGEWIARRLRRPPSFNRYRAVMRTHSSGVFSHLARTAAKKNKPQVSS